MIIDFNRYNGGGSGSGVTPEQVQQQIDSALTPYWDSAITESAITEAVSGFATEQYVQDALSGVSLEGYWNSAETKDYVDGRIDGYDSGVTLQIGTPDDLFRIKGIINCAAGNVDFMALGATILSTTDVEPYMLKPIPQDPSLGTINYVAVGFLYETNSTGSPTGVYYGFQNNGVFVEGEPVQLVRDNVEPSTHYTTPQGRGDGYFIIDSDNYTITWSAQPVVSVHIDGVYDAIDVLDADIQELSARTIPDMSLYTPTSGFSTINGSAITNGGNIVIQGGGGDVSGYWNSAQTKSYVDNNVRGVQDQIDTMDEVAAAAIVDLNNRVLDSVTVSNFNNWVGDEVGSILVNAGVATSSGRTYSPVAVATQSDVQDAVHSNDIRHIVKCTQAEYDDPSFIWDPETLYIIVNNSN